MRQENLEHFNSYSNSYIGMNIYQRSEVRKDGEQTDKMPNIE